MGRAIINGTYGSKPLKRNSRKCHRCFYDGVLKFENPTENFWKNYLCVGVSDNHASEEVNPGHGEKF